MYGMLSAVTVLAACVAGSVATSAATPSSKVASPPHSPVELNFWDMPWGTTDTQKEEKAIVAQFNASHPDIQVKFTQLGWGDYTQKYLSAVQANNPPDVGGGDSGIPFVMNAQGQALPINDLYKQWQKNGTFKDMTSWAYKKWMYGKNDIGITWQVDTRFILYRKDLFRKAGVKPPTTWNQLLAAAKKLNKGGVIGIAAPGKQGSYDTDQFYMTFVFQAGGSVATKQGKAAFDTPQQLKALEFEKSLISCCAAKATPAWSFAEVEKAYDQGKAAMAFGGGWFIADLVTASKGPKGAATARKILNNTGVLPVLIGPGGKKAQHTVAFANPWMIFKGSQHPKEAKTFLKWMMAKKTLSKIYAAAPGGIWPVYKSLVKTRAFTANPLIKTIAKQETTKGVDYWYPYNKGAIGIAGLGTSIADVIVNPVLSGARSPKDALSDAQRKLSPLFR